MTLNEKIRDVLARLATLSEAPASNLEPRTSHGAASSKIPAGATLRRDSNRPPSKERSLHDFYAWHFAENADDPGRLLTYYLLAERDYMTRRYHVPDRMALRSGGLTENDSIDGGAAERVAAERVIDLYEGMAALEVAIHEFQTEEWVKKARRIHGRDPHDGRPRAEFLGWDEARRVREVASLAERMGQKAAADKLRVSKRTVQKYWPQELAPA